MTVRHLFIAYCKYGDRYVPVLVDGRNPGDELFRFIREFGDNASLGRYRRLDLREKSPTLGYHLFEHGIVKINQVHI